MDSLSPNEIAGVHLATYEKYLHEVNPSNSDIIKALDAATFLRKSGLNQLTLKTIWDLSDPNCLGYLDKKAFFISLKLIAMIQNDHPVNINDISRNFPPPIISENVLSQIDWRIPNEKVTTYTDLFNSLIPVDGKLSGSKVKPQMMTSKLPVDILTKIWDLSDIDQDGFLNLNEFILSCHLTSKAAQGLILPSQLPPTLSNFDHLQNQQATSSLSSISMSPPPPQSLIKEATASPVNWVISAQDKELYDENFAKLDKDNDGLVNGFDVKDTLLQSGLTQNVLAHIWNLCDIKSNGMLNSEQFALANYFIKQKQNGVELPMQLSFNMIPPSLRPTESTSNENLNETTSQASLTGNKELDSLTEEIKQLQLEKVKYESEVTTEEASLRLKQSEIKNIQNEIETLSQMLKQLENQKNDASKRLEDLNSQLTQLEVNLHDLKTKFCLETQKVDNLNQQYLDQKKNIDVQETDLNSKRKEFETLKNEEVQLEAKLSLAKNEAEQASKNATDTQLEISQIRTNFVELEEYERRVNEMLSDYDYAIQNQDIVKIASLLPRSITPPPFVALEPQNIDDFNVSKEFNADPFAGEDPFKDDPFGSNKAGDAFGSDNFANFDAFGNGVSSKNFNNDPFGSSFSDQVSSSPGDAFRSESPTPALPPKKSKPPPPRPAPPKSSQNKTPLRAAPPPPVKDQSAFNSNFDPFNDNRDPFGSDSFATQSFANFANFDKA